MAVLQWLRRGPGLQRQSSRPSCLITCARAITASAPKRLMWIARGALSYFTASVIRTVQDLWGRADVKTPMIYPHVLNKGGRGVLSPPDAL